MTGQAPRQRRAQRAGGERSHIRSRGSGARSERKAAEPPRSEAQPSEVVGWPSPGPTGTPTAPGGPDCDTLWTNAATG
jgi:hypothetical protein